MPTKIMDSYNVLEKKHHKLDTKNKKIISLLSENSRMAFTEIARKVGLSKESVQYRYKQLLSKKLILGAYAEIDFEKLKFKRYHILLLLDESDQEKQKKFIESLLENPNVIRVTEFNDNWDLEITLLARSLKDFDQVTEEMLSPFSEIIQDKDIEAEIERVESHSFPEFKKVNGKEKVSLESPEEEKVSYDDKDLKILQLLCKDSRMSTYKIAEGVKLSADAIGLRIKRLLKNGIINKFTITLNCSLLGYEWFTFCFNTACLAKSEEKKFFYYAKENSYLVTVKRMLGDWDIKSNVVVKDPAEFHKLIKDIKVRFGKIIRSYETWVVFREHVFNSFPKVLLQKV
jgi:Lrp/AsnC family transcriptional regulator, leucine-responsive regulatory protein